MADCTCGRLKVGSHVTDTKTWNASCPEHGSGTPWYESPEQTQNRKEQSERLRDLQRQAVEARRRARGEVDHG